LKFACFWAYFLKISVLRIALFSNFMALLLFQFAAKDILRVFVNMCSFWAYFFGFASLLF